MVRTIASIFISALLLIAVSLFERYNVNRIFEDFREQLVCLYEKTQDKNASLVDGESVRLSWTNKKKKLHVWVTHTSVENVDYQLNEAIGYLSEGKHDDALPKIEVLIEMTKKIPEASAFRFENVF